jgi:hypothetical protein
MAGFLASSESSPSPEQMEFCRIFLSKWNFLGIRFGGLLARIAEYLLNGSPREVKFHIIQGCAGSFFQIMTFCSVKLGWKVTTIQTREATTGNDNPAEEIVYDGEEKVADEDEASLEEDDADRQVKAVCQLTPIKLRWIVPLLLNENRGEAKHVQCRDEACCIRVCEGKVHHQFSVAECKDNGQG